MPVEQPSRSSEDQAKSQKERTLSDARLLEGGAEYVVDVGGGLRLEVTPDQFVEIHGEMVEELQRRFRDEIQKDINDVPIEDIIASHPELAAHVEAIPLGKEEGEPISLIRMRGVPALAIPVWSKSKMRGGTMGRVLLQVPDARLPYGIPHIAEFRSVCACCKSETREVQSPFQAHMPKWPEGVPLERAASMHQRAMEEWRATEEGKRDTEWHEQKKQAYRDAMQRACTENGIQFLVMRHGKDAWVRQYGELESVEMMEITELDALEKQIRALRIGAGLPEEARGFTVRG